MVIQVNIQEAKGCLSRLVASAEKGEEIVIARAGRPVVRLAPVEDARVPRLGFLGSVDVPEEAFAPLSADELRDWGLD
ncbi:MAG: type II toxin-antitoxin system prevent-host-death family antitoxin [Bifidobacteriaceae bacterium]|jgi:prevent-host-death family protein|nr:type II toxin-antitoxin system prevent-host-death family antitoxin [Bifidobacteriaceae bacterium]